MPDNTGTLAFCLPHPATLDEALEVCRAEALASARYLKNVDAVSSAVAQLDLAVFGMADRAFDPSWPLMSASSISSARRFPGRLTLDLEIWWDDRGEVVVQVRDGDDRAIPLLAATAHDSGWERLEGFVPRDDDARAGRSVRLTSELFDRYAPTIVTGAEDGLDASDHDVVPIPDPMCRLRALVERLTISRSPMEPGPSNVPESVDGWVAIALEDPLWAELAARMRPLTLADLHTPGCGGPVHDLSYADLTRARRRAEHLMASLPTTDPR